MKRWTFLRVWDDGECLYGELVDNHSGAASYIAGTDQFFDGRCVFYFSEETWWPHLGPGADRYGPSISLQQNWFEVMDVGGGPYGRS